MYGGVTLVDEASLPTERLAARPFDFKQLLLGDYIAQPAAFLRRRVIDIVGPLDEALHLCMDYDLWLRLGPDCHARALTETYLAEFRVHAAAKSSAHALATTAELEQILTRAFARPAAASFQERCARRAFAHLWFRHAQVLIRSQQWDEARPWVLRALRHYPALFIDVHRSWPWLVPLLGLGPGVTGHLAAMKRHLEETIS